MRPLDDQKQRDRRKQLTTVEAELGDDLIEVGDLIRVEGLACRSLLGAARVYIERRILVGG